MSDITAAAGSAGLAAFGGRGTDEKGIRVLSSNRPFAHEETAYDTQYENADFDLAPGNRLTELLVEQGVAQGSNILEIGCGTGLLSVGLAARRFYGDIVVTDGSMSFLRIAQKKLKSMDLDSRVCLALLTDEDVVSIADAHFDVIAMRSVLHHITDFQAFAGLLLRKLKPGGILAAYEPRAEMFLWMATVMSLFPDIAKAKGMEITEADRSHIDLFVDTMRFYLRRDIDKSAGEDKYAFWSTEVLDIAASAGAKTIFRSESNPDDLLTVLISYAKYCMSFPQDLIEKISTGLSEFRDTLASLLPGYHIPDIAGWYLLIKER